jgi:Na+-transporting NADH:ubiquinone oxidoreductase subunit NqrC
MLLQSEVSKLMFKKNKTMCVLLLFLSIIFLSSVIFARPSFYDNPTQKALDIADKEGSATIIVKLKQINTTGSLDSKRRISVPRGPR